MTQKEQDKLMRKADRERERQEKAEAREQALRARAQSANGRERARLLRRAEQAQIRANAHKVRGKQLTQRASGEINDQEWKRIGRSRRNHWFYDRISAVTKRFQPRNPLREEGMTFQQEGEQFENQGRIFLGGTKAMNRFTDSTGKEWLCKEAVTCVGTYKPVGALVTEAASRLQEKISPDTAIRAFTYRGKNGRVFGSLQERILVKQDGFDLFKWQSDTSKPLPQHLTGQILREHVTDWLLCNFDTKGENFLEDDQGRLRGIDKEQSLSFLDHKDAQHMSYRFSPNPNKTLYNSVFELCAQGKLDLDLKQVDQYIRRVEAMSGKEYLGLFHDAVAAKCKGNARKMAAMEDKILARKEGLRGEYQRFFGELAAQRGEQELLDEKGLFDFSKGEAPARTPAAEKEGLEKDAPAAEKEAPVQSAAPKKPGLDRSLYERPLTLEESIQAQKLHTELGRAVRAVSRQLEEDLSPERRAALTQVKERAETIRDYNAKRLSSRITPEEKTAFHQLLDPAHAAGSGARPEVVKFTQDLQKAMAPKEKAPAAPEAKPLSRQAAQLHKAPAAPTLGRR